MRPSFLALTLALLAMTAPAGRAADLVSADYDPRTHEGRLLVAGTEANPVVLASQVGRYPAEWVDVTVVGRPGHLVLWKGSPRDPSVFPELWARAADGGLRRLWPADEEFAWVEPEIDFLVGPEPAREETLTVRRQLPTSRLDEESLWTVEVLRLGAQGLALVSKDYEPWTSERQLVALCEDLLVSGRPELITAMIERHRAAGHPLGAPALRAIAKRARLHGVALGVSSAGPAAPNFDDLETERSE